jgi:cytochrome c-type biogenesis protein CcmH/NrfG
MTAERSGPAAPERAGAQPAGSDRIDPDELALLEEERDHLLASLEDLERERRAGDLDEADYESLRDGYTVRAAEVLTAIEQRRYVLRSRARPANRRRTIVTAAAVLGFAVVAGVLVAQGAGQRGGGPITGAIDNLRAELVRCQTASMQDPAAGITCYDGLLADAPDNVEALTYQGWAYIRDDRVSEGAANLERAVQVDPDYPDARVFRAIVASRAGEHRVAADEIDRFYRNRPAPAAVQILRSQGLEREVFIRLLDESTRDCWARAAGESDRESGAPDAAAFLGSLGACLDEALATSPEDTDALVSRAYALLASGSGSVAQGAELAGRAVAADPSDPNALLMRASVAVVDGRPEDAAADLDALEGMQRPTISFLIGGPEELRSAVEEQLPTTTTTRPERSAGGVTIPNPDGG